MNSFICNSESNANLNGRLGSYVNQSRSFFDKWSLCESDRFKAEVLGILGFDQSIAASTDNQCNAVDWLNGLGNTDYAGRDSRLLLKELLARALFSKDEDLRSNTNKELAAMRSFLQSEETCRQVNRNFRYSFSPQIGDFPSDIHSILYVAGRKIEEILGDVPDLSSLALSFGPGATSTTTSKTSPRYKLSSNPTISDSLLPIAGELQDLLPLWFNHFNNEIVVTNSRLEFVPKNYKTYRAIGIEPSVNTMVQKAYGNYIRKRLLKHGVNLKDQNINKNRALNGSINDDISTIDLERASDSMSYGLVLELLPHPWFEALDRCRSGYVDVTDFDNTIVTVPLEKFSSMGNGYTFELESMLFYAIGYAVSVIRNHTFDLTVYGDDLICNTPLAKDLSDFFPHVGFFVNKEKSFYHGPFRESCGGDFLEGVDVRPFFIRRRMTFDIVTSYFNFLQRKPWFDPEYKLRVYFLSVIPENKQLWGPDGFGDGHLIDFDHVPIPHGRQYEWSGYSFTTFTQEPYSELSTRKSIGDGLYPTSSNFADNTVTGDVLVVPYLASVQQFETYILPYGLADKIRRSLTYAPTDFILSLREYAVKVQCSTDGSSILSLRKPQHHKVKARKTKVYYMGLPDSHVKMDDFSIFKVD